MRPEHRSGLLRSWLTSWQDGSDFRPAFCCSVLSVSPKRLTQLGADTGYLQCLVPGLCGLLWCKRKSPAAQMFAEVPGKWCLLLPEGLVHPAWRSSSHALLAGDRRKLHERDDLMPCCYSLFKLWCCPHVLGPLYRVNRHGPCPEPSPPERPRASGNAPPGDVGLRRPTGWDQP